MRVGRRVSEDKGERIAESKSSQSALRPGGLRPQFGSPSKQTVGTCIGDLTARRLVFPSVKWGHDPSMTVVRKKQNRNASRNTGI